MNILGNGVLISLYIWAIFFNWYLLFTYTFVLAVYFTMSYVKSKKAIKNTRRKIQMATWNESGNPSCFCELKMPLENVDEFISDFNKEHPETPIDYSHLTLKSLACGIEMNNGKICFGNFVKNESVDICLVLDMKDDKFDYIIVEGCNKLPLVELAKQVEEKKKTYGKSTYF